MPGYAESRVIDSYTGIPWCGHGLHLLEGDNVTIRANGTRLCLPCAARKKRNERRKKKRQKVREQWKQKLTAVR